MQRASHKVLVFDIRQKIRFCQDKYKETHIKKSTNSKKI